MVTAVVHGISVHKLDPVLTELIDVLEKVQHNCNGHQTTMFHSYNYGRRTLQWPSFPLFAVCRETVCLANTLNTTHALIGNICQPTSIHYAQGRNKCNCLV